jgi:Zn-dependent peptidase ImmA (M78 family)
MNISKIEPSTIDSKSIISCLFQRCGIKEPPTQEQLCFDFMRLESSTFETKDKDWADGDPSIQGVCAVNERMILVNDALKDDIRRRFTHFHELGHFMLPEHREIIYRCRWDDLSHSTKIIMERQANEFAADCLFQLNRFEKEACEMRLGFDSILTLKEKYQTSIESTARRYVEKHFLPCALVVYEPIADPENENNPILQVQYTIKSKSFTHFGKLVEKQQVSRDSLEQKVFMKRVTSLIKPGDNKDEGTLTVEGEGKNSTRVFPVECFTNGYKLLELVFPPSTALGI